MYQIFSDINRLKFEINLYIKIDVMIERTNHLSIFQFISRHRDFIYTRGEIMNIVNLGDLQIYHIGGMVSVLCWTNASKSPNFLYTLSMYISFDTLMHHSIKAIGCQ